MIFGNPGIYLNDGSYSNFSILVEHLTSDFYSVNFCVDNQIFPNHLAYNKKSIIFYELLNEDYFITQSPNIFKLDDRDLMISLIKESFSTKYRREEIIRDGLAPKSLTEQEWDRYYNLFEESMNYPENRDKLWEIDCVEYTNMGFYVFVVNNDGRTKVVLIDYSNIDDNELFFDRNKKPKQIGFFDNNIWKVKVIEISTEVIVSILMDIKKKFKL